LSRKRQKHSSNGDGVLENSGRQAKFAHSTQKELKPKAKNQAIASYYIFECAVPAKLNLAADYRQLAMGCNRGNLYTLTFLA
jgi:hypothetical protein